MLLLLSFLIIIHELGHFFAARLFNIKVDKFGFGLPIGPTIYKTKWGETEVLVHLMLLGGYVSFPDDDEKSDLPEDSDERFKNKPVSQRAIVIAAGVIANIIAAFCFIFVTAVIWHKLPSGKVNLYISRIVAAKDSSVAKSGILPGDKVYKINGSVINTTGAINMFAFYSRQFDGQVSEDTVKNKLTELQKLNNISDATSTLPKGTVIKLPKFEDEKSVKLSYYQIIGLEKYKTDDKKLSSEQKTLRNEIYDKKEFVIKTPITLEDVATAASDTQKPINIIVQRDENFVTLKPIYSNDKGIIGIEKKPVELFVHNNSFFGAIYNSCRYLYDNTKMMLIGLEKLFTGQVPLNDLHGIVAITKIGTDIIEESGMFKGFLLTAIISLNLAIVNLLPIPALDGGHLLFLLIEKIQGKPLNEKITEKISSICFSLLIVLMFYIIFNDIFALITKKI